MWFYKNVEVKRIEKEDGYYKIVNIYNLRNNNSLIKRNKHY